jgi:hypothetical protein
MKHIEFIKKMSKSLDPTTDPVHPNAHIYAKMALNILEKVAPSFSKGNSSEGQRKIKRNDSESVSMAPAVVRSASGEVTTAPALDPLPEAANLVASMLPS